MAKLNIVDGVIRDTNVMGVPIKIQIVPRVTGKHRPGTKTTKTATVYHETGNQKRGATAQMHSNWLHNLEKNPIASQVSWHFTVDDKEVIQNIPITEVAYCQGTADGNRVGISIEQCINSDGNRAKAEENACKLHAALIETLGLRLTRHYDWSGKNCPALILNAKRWPDITKMIEKYRVEFNGQSKTPILRAPTTTVAKMKSWATAKGADQLFIDLAGAFYDAAIQRGIDPAVIYAQSAKETNYFKFTGVLNKTFRNTCGLKTKSGGANEDPNAHQRFDSWDDGIRAHADHLALYAGAPGYPKPAGQTPDPRHFSSIAGVAKNVEDLGGINRWAPSPLYGLDIVKRMEGLKEEVAADMDNLVSKQNLKGAVIQYNTKAEEFAKVLSAKLSVPRIRWDVVHDFYPYEIVICVGDQAGIGNYTGYMTHFVNAQDDWSAERNAAFMASAVENINRYARRRDK